MADFVIEGRAYTVELREPAPSEEALANFEQDLNLRLPDALRAYYLRFNGGLPCPDDLPEDSGLALRLVWADGVSGAQGGEVAFFAGLFKIDHANESLDFARSWRDFEDRVPAGYLAFGRDPGGSLFLIGTADHNLGEVFFWSRAFEADRGADQPPTDDNIAFVAPSFKDFLLALRAEPAPGESSAAWIERVYRG